MIIDTMTLRKQARALVLAEVEEADRRDHMCNYSRLHVYRDGSVSWFYSIDRYSDLIDDQAETFRAIPSVCLVGTGSVGCNCEFCNQVGEEDGYADKDEAVDACIAEHGTYQREKDMLARFDAIEPGYFDDEEEESR